jgi:hypothetical protein
MKENFLTTIDAAMRGFKFENLYESERYLGRAFCYIGTLRNAKKFDIGDDVFFTTKRYNTGVLVHGIICGVLLEPAENPEYRYSVQVVANNETNPIFKVGEIFKDVKCDSIFFSVEEAKQSAIENLEETYKLQRDYIDNFFKQFEEAT